MSKRTKVGVLVGLTCLSTLVGTFFWLRTHPIRVISQYRLGRKYWYGEKVQRDDAQAVYWYSRAANKGYAPAELALGVAYHFGRGVGRNDEAALKWVTLAANQGDAQAAYILAGAFEQGDGASLDMGKAIAWYKRSASEGFKDAQSSLDRIESLQRNQSLIQTIQSRGDFNQCTSTRLELHRMQPGTCSLPAPYCENMTRGTEEHSLMILSNAGYIGGPSHPITTQYSTQTSYWTLNDKGQMAMGKDIREQKIAAWSNGEVAYDWNLVLGCRKFAGLDAVTQLADGTKVDFSWTWDVTDLGRADGLNGERQRGIAYIVPNSGGPKLDRISFEP